MTDQARGVSPDWTVSDVGTGDAIVLVHGLGTDSSAWSRVAPALAQHFRVLTVDLPGYSLRSVVDRVPSVTELADGLAEQLAVRDVERAVFVGHSFGGAVSLLTADARPERCAGLVLVAPGGFGTELNPLIPLIGTRFGSRLLGSLYGPRTSRTIERVAARVQGRSGQDSRVRIAELMETYERLRTEQARAQFRAGVRQSLALNSAADRPRITALDRSIPVLVLWGREDRVLPSWQAKNAAALLPWATVHLIDGAGHTPHRSHPIQTTREIRAFADSREVLQRFSPAGS